MSRRYRCSGVMPLSVCQCSSVNLSLCVVVSRLVCLYSSTSSAPSDRASLQQGHILHFNIEYATAAGSAPENHGHRIER